MDKHHGHGGSFEYDPKTKQRVLKDEPTDMSGDGGPRDSKGKPIVEKRAEKPEPAIPAAPARAPWEGDEPAKTEKKGA